MDLKDVKASFFKCLLVGSFFFFTVDCFFEARPVICITTDATNAVMTGCGSKRLAQYVFATNFL